MPRRARITVEREWAAKAKRKAEIIALLKDPRFPPNTGVNIPLRNDPVVSVAIAELVKEHPNLLEMVQQPNGKMLLLKKAKLAAAAQDKNSVVPGLRAAGIVLDADNLLLMDDANLPGVVMRRGVDDDAPEGTIEAPIVETPVIPVHGLTRMVAARHKAKGKG